MARSGLRVLPMGDAAVLVEVPSLAHVLALHADLVAQRATGCAPPVDDLVPAERTVLIRFAPGRSRVADVAAWAEAVWVAGGGADGAGGHDPLGERVEVAVRYDGADLDDVGRLTGLGAAGVVAAHTGTEWRVAFTGFTPGFGYLIGGDPRLQVPRLPAPRVRVPAGSVALAGGYCGVYPRPSPGGWQLIGSTDAAVWDVDRDPPGLLRPGVRVRFVPVPG